MKLGDFSHLEIFEEGRPNLKAVEEARIRVVKFYGGRVLSSSTSLRYVCGIEKFEDRKTKSEKYFLICGSEIEDNFRLVGNSSGESVGCWNSIYLQDIRSYEVIRKI